jgi:hypothetical protein
MKVMLLRIGMDKGTDGALGPIFEDGSFEYIPLSERDDNTKETRTYRNTVGRCGLPLSEYLPMKIGPRKLHYDPEFESFTYGDPTSKRQSLLKLVKDDLLVFYAGLMPYKNSKQEEALYIIGYFTIDKIIDLNSLNTAEYEIMSKRYSNNAHFKRSYFKDTVIAVGDKYRSKLLDRAFRISEIKHAINGKRYHAVSAEMENSLGISGSIQRSIPPRLITNPLSIGNMRKMLGLLE